MHLGLLLCIHGIDAYYSSNPTYKRFIISRKPIVVKDEEGKFHNSYVTGVTKQGFYNNDANT